MKALYLECFAGISGDMSLGALVDLGVPFDHLKQELSKLNINGFSLEANKQLKLGIEGTKLDVKIDEHSQGHGHGHGHKHLHRNLNDIKKIIFDSDLSQKVKQNSYESFERVAKAEAKIHGKAIDQVHFHEVGAIDSIVDIIGVAICLEYLAPEKILCSKVELGGGFVKCAHGTFPVPAPATMEILQGVPVRKGTVDKETTTPTGAAIIAQYVDEFADQADFTIERTAYGIGYYDLEIPNVLRVSWVEYQAESSIERKEAWVMECNLDDMSPEYFEHIFKTLLEKGAQDVFLTPILMKKSRPAFTLSVLYQKNREAELQNTVFEETTTLGIRSYPIQKAILKREFLKLETKFGPIKVKLAHMPNGKVKSKPEHDDCVRAAKEFNMSIQDVLLEVNQELLKLQRDGK